MNIDEALHSLAESQHALVTRRQLRTQGLSTSAIRHRIDRGLLKPLSPQVLRMGGSPATREADSLAAVLDAGDGAAVALHSAMAWWGVPGFPLRPIHLLHVRCGRPRPARLAIVHTTRVLPDHHVVVLRGIPLTTPTRTLFDVAACIHPARLERALDWCWSRMLTGYAALHSMLGELACRGRPGIEAMGTLLAQRPADYAAPESGLEGRFGKLVELDGQPPLDRQVNIGGECWIGRIDFVDRLARVLVQIDSDLFHGSLLDQRLDGEQTAALQTAGWVVIRVPERDLWHSPGDLVRRIRVARMEGRARHA